MFAQTALSVRHFSAFVTADYILHGQREALSAPDRSLGVLLKSVAAVIARQASSQHVASLELVSAGLGQLAGHLDGPGCCTFPARPFRMMEAAGMEAAGASITVDVIPKTGPMAGGPEYDLSVAALPAQHGGGWYPGRPEALGAALRRRPAHTLALVVDNACHFIRYRRSIQNLALARVADTDLGAWAGPVFDRLVPGLGVHSALMALAAMAEAVEQAAHANADSAEYTLSNITWQNKLRGDWTLSIGIRHLSDEPARTPRDALGRPAGVRTVSARRGDNVRQALGTAEGITSLTITQDDHGVAVQADIRDGTA